MIKSPLGILLADGSVALIIAVLAGSAVGAATAAPIGLLTGLVLFGIGVTIAYRVASGYRDLGLAGPAGRYRLRTRLRALEPGWLYSVWVIPKGPGDCGLHEFYNDDGIVDRCCHCVVGLRLRTAGDPPAP